MAKIWKQPWFINRGIEREHVILNTTKYYLAVGDLFEASIGEAIALHTQKLVLKFKIHKNVLGRVIVVLMILMLWKQETPGTQWPI